ncbi:Fructose-specific phosphotransferase enzyme IIB component [Listeria fleischmannii 1991]|uniref:Fructose-specific phosphotransferase enzyme IIB component n=2 Tax=Listeria fleischmannii TaxID=1069827 RepID=A0A2X3G1C0_9LIST|nr:PTS sugar transporter subunit IIB [Listeria fleischmannii]EMG27204.1 PTS system, Mannose/sorbose specific IIB subunit [Listeria fleischmannii subsp. fleischmannii LU2006-1]KMT59924.1 Fructose-specific phosphotransferase enzyme IIB component [Listeria fleischmannii 1991]SQC62342.1 Fructose-specific phosphotransferase enzyme IIB component [Listeria fleischmannii subsp. fleischmannii]
MSSNGIIHVRIDERLIHGQVATMWTNTIKATRIMIVDDGVVKSEIEKTALKTAVPSGVKLSILTSQGAIKNILADKYIGQKVFLIVKNPRVLKELVDGGVTLPQINVGNMSTKKDSKQIKKSVSVTEEDLENFDYFVKKGIKLTAQMVPSEEEVPFQNLLKK